MTFTEAAVEVLRLVGRPLHYKKITEIAIERNRLSHVGKSPEITMSSRLATLVKKDRGEAEIVKVKPGVFGLREWPKEVLAMGELEEGDVEDILEAIDETESTEEAEEAVAANDESTKPAEAPVAPKSTHKLPGQEVFPEEADDDEPILSKVDEPVAAESAESNRNKKRRRKKRRGEDEPRPVEAAREPRREERRDDRRDDRGRDRHPERRDDRDRDRDRQRSGRDSRDSRDVRDSRDSREPEVRGNWQREPGQGDLAGKELSDAIESTLASRGGRPRPFVDIAQSLVEKGRLSGDANALAPTIAAAVRGDVARRTATAQVPRFRLKYGEVALTEFLAGQDVARAEQDATRAVARHREIVHRALVRKLVELPNASMLEVVATWLNAVGVTSLRGVRKPGSGAGEFHLAGTLRRGPEEVPLAIVIVRDGPVGRERVVDVRGSLHRYGDARMAWIVSLRDVHSGAREESAEAGVAPVAVFDGMQLARSMEDAGVGVRRYSLPLVQLDFDLFDELRGPGAPPRPPREREPAPVSRRDERRDEEDEDEDEEPTDASEGADANDITDDADAPAAAAAGEADEEGGAKRRRRRRRRRRRGGEAEGGAAEEASAESPAGEAGLEREADADLDEDEDAPIEPDEEATHERGLDRDLDPDDDREDDLDGDDDRDREEDPDREDDLDRDDDLDREDEDVDAQDEEDDLDRDDDDDDDDDDDVEESTEIDVDDLDDER